MNLLPNSPPIDILGARVARLLQRWRDETAHISSGSQLVSHEAYQEIIQLGTEALPYLFRDLEQTHDGHLAKALTAITGVQTVADEDRGRIKTIAATWLQWAKEKGYSW